MSSPDILATQFWTRGAKVPGAWLIPLEIVPAIHGLWLASGLGNNNQWCDASMRGQELAGYGTPTATIDTDWPCASYVEFGGTSERFAYEVVEDASDIRFTGSLTLAAWIQFDVVNRRQGIIERWLDTSNDRAYTMYLNSSGQLIGAVSSDGTAANTSTATGDTLEAGVWYFCQMRFTSGEFVSVRVNDGTWTNTATAITMPVDNRQYLYIGQANQNANYRLDGRIGQAWTASQAVPTTVLDYLYAVQGPYFGKF